MIPDPNEPLRAIPPAAPATAGGSALPVAFPGIGRPSSDFAAVRDGRRSTLLYYLVDLSSARSIAANTALALEVQGNVFFADPLYDLSGNSQASVARVHFQDQNLGASGTPLTVLPSALYRVPFTRLLIENYAQAGKFLAIVYGVDVDLLPGTSQQVLATVLSTVQPAGVAHSNSGPNAGNAAASALAANAARKYLYVQNPPDSRCPIGVRADGTAAASAAGAISAGTVALRPGEWWEPRVVPTGAVSVINADGAGNQPITVIEG